MACYDFAGQAKKSIVIQTRTDTVDSYLATTYAWSTLATVWAEIIPLRAYRGVDHEALKSRVTHRITIRYLSSMSNTATAIKRRITFDGRTFSIMGVRNMDGDLKSEGTAYQEIDAVENDAENT